VALTLISVLTLNASVRTCMCVCVCVCVCVYVCARLTEKVCLGIQRTLSACSKNTLNVFKKHSLRALVNAVVTESKNSEV